MTTGSLESNIKIAAAPEMKVVERRSSRDTGIMQERALSNVTTANDIVTLSPKKTRFDLKFDSLT